MGRHKFLIESAKHNAPNASVNQLMQGENVQKDKLGVVYTKLIDISAMKGESQAPIDRTETEEAKRNITDCLSTSIYQQANEEQGVKSIVKEEDSEIIQTKPGSENFKKKYEKLSDDYVSLS